MRVRVLAAFAAALIVTACGSNSGSSSVSTSTSTAPGTTTGTQRPRPPRHSPSAPRGAKPIGTVQTVHGGGSRLSVTITHLYPSLTGTGALPPSGTRAAGVALTIANLAGATYDSTASGDLSLTLSTGAAAPLFIKAGVCQTPLTDFESLISVGETHSGCVGFAVPRRARIVAVRFSPHSRGPGTVSWTAGSGR